MKTRIIQITAGNGPAECTWVVAKVLKMVLKQLKVLKIGASVIQQEKGAMNSTVKSVAIQLSGDEQQMKDFVDDWTGSIQWIGKSMYRTYVQRKNWFVGISEISELKEIQIKDQEIRYQAMRSSGPGGQHVNKVSSAIRATHIPTGVQVVVMDTRSQHQNRKIAKQRLEKKIAKVNVDVLKDRINELWRNHKELERGNPVKVFTGPDFKEPRPYRTVRSGGKKQKKNYKSQRQQLKRDLRREL